MNYIKRRRVDEEEESEKESKLSQPTTSKAAKAVTDKIIAPNDSHLGTGFTRTGDENCLLPLSAACGKKLSNMVMVPVNLRRHTYQTKN
jgi:hypothetical protein